MNSKILNHYKKLVEENLLYLKDSTIRKSIELYIKELIDDTAQVEEEWAKNHNNNVLKSLHNESLSILERSENKMDKTISKIIVELNQLKSRSFSASIAEQILESLKKFKLKEEYKSFNGLFFEFDADPRFSGIAFKEPNFEVVLEEPKYQNFEDGGYACDYSIDFELLDVFKNILNEDFEEIAWEFEFEPDIIQKIRSTAYSIVAINLHEALLLKDVNNKLNQLGFEKGGVVYLNAHDTEEKTMFVNE